MRAYACKKAANSYCHTLPQNFTLKSEAIYSLLLDETIELNSSIRDLALR